MIYRVDVEVRTPVLATEVTDRVTDTVSNLFPDAEIERAGEGVIGRAHALDRFSELLYEQEILDTARNRFFEGRKGNEFEFRLKKQPAFGGVVNFAVGDPDELGDLTVRVRVQEPSVEEYVDHVAPPTEAGEPIEP
jgi:predicted RNA binding protein with dsRBD fold (UPF0201 family)